MPKALLAALGILAGLAVPLAAQGPAAPLDPGALLPAWRLRGEAFPGPPGVQHEEPPELREDLDYLVPFSYAAGVAETLRRTWSDLPFEHMAHRIALDGAADPAAYVAGFAVADDGDYDGLLVRFAPGGAVDWHLRIDTGPFDVLHGVAVGPDGSVVAAGYAFGPGFARPRMLAVKATPEGDVLWTRLLETSAAGAADEAYDVAVDAQGRIVLAGAAADLVGEEFRFHAAVVQLDPYGDVRFARRVSPPGAVEALEAVAFDADGGIVAAGHRVTGEERHLLAVRMAPDGEVLARAVHAAGIASTGRGVAVGPGGEVFVAGARWVDFFTAAPLLLRLDAGLDTVWAKELRVAPHAFARDVVVGADGHAHVGGTAFTHLGHLDAFVARVTPEGLALHVRIIDEPDSVDAFNPGSGLALTADGLTVLTAGSARAPASAEGALRMHVTAGPAWSVVGVPAGLANAR